MDQRVTYSSPSNGRDESGALWAGCPQALIRALYGSGKYFETDFMGKETVLFTATAATAGTFAVDPGAEGGVALADCGSATVTQGINVQADGAAVVPAAGKKIFFETRVKIDDAATGPEAFIGLCEADTTIIASSAVTSNNLVAFSSVTDNNVLAFGSKKAGSATAKAGVVTAVDGTWIKLGFIIEGLEKITPYVNGVALTEHVITTNIPEVALLPSFVCQSGGTTDPILSIDWVKCYQLD